VVLGRLEFSRRPVFTAVDISAAFFPFIKHSVSHYVGYVKLRATMSSGGGKGGKMVLVEFRAKKAWVFDVALR